MRTVRVGRLDDTDPPLPGSLLVTNDLPVPLPPSSTAITTD